MTQPRRKRLPNRRPAVQETLLFNDQLIYATAGVDPETGRVSEIFLTASKEGSLLNHTLGDAATVISVALQHGVSIEALRVSLATLAERTPAPAELDHPPAAGRAPASPIGAALAFLARVEADLQGDHQAQKESPDV
ncbi:MAG: hypothetical protein RIB45_17755 [Marivibrio sp.]|uniref:hypothetical protein n=1 Tax=Marivibrio sp. TaxID=2039719 RepID=UPI0032EFE313